MGLSVVFLRCGTLPTIKHNRYDFPSGAFLGEVKKPYAVIGEVRSRVDFSTLDLNEDENALCRNYYNKAVMELIRHTKEGGGDAVIQIRSVVFLQNGKMEKYTTPECSDDGTEGQILLEGVGIRWKMANDEAEGSGKNSLRNIGD